MAARRDAPGQAPADPAHLVPAHRDDRRFADPAPRAAGVRVGFPPDRHRHLAARHSYMTQNVQMASLDHALWFHRPFRVDEWLLYSFDSPTAQGGRGLARGQIFSRDGALVASSAQEGLIRVRNGVAGDD
ncbi:acyl-CoA thioesterase [Rhodanobacter sp. UC4439_H6]